jgi:hypothetical protein
MTVSVAVRERIIVLASALACGCLFVAALALVFADLAMARPSAMIASWERGQPMPDHHLRRELLARMGRAIAVNPLDARQRMELGRFFAWHAARHRAGSARGVFYNELAAERFAEAVLARPTWGFAWALLAEQWVMSGQAQEQILYALRRAVELSPYEPGVQLKSLWLGLGLWDVLDEPLRAQLTASLMRIMSQREYFARAAAIALHHQRADLLNIAAPQPWQRTLLERLARARGP